MTQLADWSHWLSIYRQLLQDDVCFQAILPVVRIAFGLVYALFLLSHGYIFPLYLAVGFILGIAFLSTSQDAHARLAQTWANRLPHHRTAWQDDQEAHLASDKQSDSLALFYPPLTASADRLLEYFYRDFIQSWWAPLNVNHDTTFDKMARNRLNGCVSNIENILLKQERNDLVMATVYGVANVLIIHMREYRNFETSGLLLTHYIDQNPHSPFAQLISEEEQHRQLRTLSATIVKRILPPSDTQSPIVMSMMTELLATYLFGSILQTCSDPDYINQYIVDYLSESEPNGQRLPDQNNAGQGVDGLRGALERAAESLMAAHHQQEDAGTGPTNRNRDDAKRNTLDTQQAVCQRTEPLSPPPLPTTPTPHQGSTADNFIHVSKEKSSPNGSPLVPRKDDLAAKKTSKPQQTATTPSSEQPAPVHPTMLSPIPQSGNSANSLRSPPVPNRKLTVPRIEESSAESAMIFTPGTVNFSIMDISAFNSDGSHGGWTEKGKMLFMVQIERPALMDHNGSEGGGYVITRTYTDFEVFHAIISARHAKRVAKIHLRLPLDPIRSWLKLGTGGQASPMATDADAICRHLEKYLASVVHDAEVGRDPIILAFLRKERRVSTGGNQGDAVDVSFADEYMDEVNAYTALSEKSGPGSPSSGQSSVGKAISMFARAPSLAAKSVTSSLADLGNAITPAQAELSAEFVSSPTQEQPRRWFHRRSVRQGSVSSLVSSNSSSGREDTSTEEDHDTQSSSHDQGSSAPSSLASSVVHMAQDTQDESKPSQAIQVHGKPLTALDIELLIETTFALVVEIFDLTTANNRAWMRRTLLNLLREIVRRSYTEIIAEQYSAYINDYLSPDALVELCDHLTQRYWPNGVWASASPERTAKEKEQTRQQAKALLMAAAVPSGVRQLIGEQNCSAAMDRLWSRCQDPALNRVLLLQILERTMRPIFG